MTKEGTQCQSMASLHVCTCILSHTSHMNTLYACTHTYRHAYVHTHVHTQTYSHTETHTHSKHINIHTHSPRKILGFSLTHTTVVLSNLLSITQSGTVPRTHSTHVVTPCFSLLRDSAQPWSHEAAAWGALGGGVLGPVSRPSQFATAFQTEPGDFRLAERVR